MPNRQGYVHTADQNFHEEILGRGLGDPDVYGYPGQRIYIGQDKAVVQRTSESGTRRTWSREEVDYDSRIDEEQEDNFNE